MIEEVGTVAHFAYDNVLDFKLRARRHEDGGIQGSAALALLNVFQHSSSHVKSEEK